MGTIVAMLPILWAMTLSLTLMRPYAIRTLRKLSLRFGADVFWLSYVLMRDGILIATVVLSPVFLYPNVLHDTPIPVTASLSGVFALWAPARQAAARPGREPGRLPTVGGSADDRFCLVPCATGAGGRGDLSIASRRVGQFLRFQPQLYARHRPFYVAIALVAGSGAFVFAYVLKKSAPKADSRYVAPRQHRWQEASWEVRSVRRYRDRAT